MASGVRKIISLSIALVSALVLGLSKSSYASYAQEYLKREHSLVKPYQGSGINIPNWDFMGTTFVTSSYVRLTPDHQSKRGGIWNSVPIRSKHWEVQVQFKVHGQGTNLFGDGLAIWYARDKMEDGPVFGSKDFFSGLAIIVDTYSNHRGSHNHDHPYISAMVNNGSMHYDHDRDGTHTQLAGCEVKLRNLDHDSFIAIRYEKNTLIVSHDLKDKALWDDCLRVDGVVLPTGYFVGVTATTGDLSDNHDIISVKFYELDVEGDDAEENRNDVVPSALHFEPPREHIEEEKEEESPAMSGFKKFLIVVFGTIALLTCVGIGLYFYSQHKEQNRRRFY